MIGSIKRKGMVFGIVLVLVYAALVVVPLNVNANGTDGLVGYWRFDEGSGTTAYDETLNDNDGTINGATWVSGISGKALEFDGVDDYVVIPHSESLNITGSITIEVWTKPGVNPLYQRIVGKCHDVNAQPFVMYSLGMHGYSPFFSVGVDGAVREAWAITDVEKDQWCHLVGTYDGTDVKIYVNGVLEDTLNYPGTIMTNDNPVNIGLYESDGRYYDGVIDEVSIWSRALNASEISESYYTTWLNYTKLGAYWPLDEGVGQYANDTSGNDNDGALMPDYPGGNSPVWVDGISGKALEFDGVDDYVQIPDNSSLDITENLTISIWFKTPSIIPSDQASILIGKGDWSAAQTNYHIFLEFRASEGKNYKSIAFAMRPASTWYNFYTTTKVTADTWYNIVVTYEQSNVTLYVNGTLDNTISFSQPMISNDYPLLFGFGQNAPPNHHFNGIIDEVSIWSRILDGTEISQNYYKIWSYHIRLAARWPFNEGVGQYTNDTSGNNNDGTLMPSYPGNIPTWTNGISGFALDFDGVDDYVAVPDDDSLDITDAITIEAWFQFSVDPYGITQSRSYLVDKNGAYRIWYSSNGEGNSDPDQFFLDLWDWDGISTRNITWEQNEWYYLVATYNGTEARIYVNGELNNITTFTKALHVTTAQLAIGSQSTQVSYWTGLIDEVSIWSRALNASEIEEHFIENWNDPPVADADGPYITDEGTPITFNASGSSDPDDDELQYRWDFDNDSIWDTSYSTDPTATHTYDDDYSGDAVVEVYDGEETDNATVMVTVNNVPPTVTIDVTLPDYYVLPGDEIIFNGSFEDPGNDIHTIEWDFDDGNTTTDILNVTHAYSEAGIYNVTLTVTDDDGGIGAYSVTIGVLSPQEAIEEVKDAVDDLDICRFIKKVLKTPLNLAIKFLNKADRFRENGKDKLADIMERVAILELKVFQKIVNVMEGKCLTEEEVNTLISMTDPIIENLQG